MFFIIANTVTLATDIYPDHSPYTNQILEYINIFFTWVFTIEAVLKLLGLGIPR